MGRSAKATGNVPRLSRRSSEPISRLQDLLDLLREDRNQHGAAPARCAEGAPGEGWLLREPRGERIDELEVRRGAR